MVGMDPPSPGVVHMTTDRQFSETDTAGVTTKAPYEKPVLIVAETNAATQKSALTIETTFAGPS